MNEGFLMSLADTWLGKGLATIILIMAGAVGGWWTSRANIMNAVNARVETLINHLEKEVGRVTTAHLACEERLDHLNGRIEQISGELAQAKQTLASIERVGKQ